MWLISDGETEEKKREREREREIKESVIIEEKL